MTTRRPTAAAFALISMAAMLAPACSSSNDGTAPEPPATAPRCSELEAASVPAIDGPLSADAAVAAAQRWRATQGLPSDVASTVAAGLTRAADGSYPLSAGDRGIMATHTDAALSAAAQYGAAFADSYGGVWWNAGRVTIGFVNGTDDRQAELKARGIDAVAVPVVHTAAQLAALETPIRAYVLSRSLARSISVRYDINAVAVEASGDAVALRSDLGRQFGDGGLCVA